MGLSPLKVAQPVEIVEWLDDQFYLPPGSSQVTGKWITQPSQVAIAGMFGNDAIREVYFQKSARLGYSKLLVGCNLYFAEHKKRQGALYQPSDPFAQRFVVTELNPVFAHVPAIQKIFPEWKKNGTANNKDNFKSYGGIPWYYLGAANADNFRALTLQVVLLDEVDAYDSDLEGEGSILTLARRRLTGAAYPKLIAGSTPTTAGASVIETMMSEADQVFRFYLPCPHEDCQGEQVLKWGGKNTSFGMKWDDSLPNIEAKSKSCYYQCEHCQKKITYSQVAAMQRAGRWISEDLTWTRDGKHFFDEDGNLVSTPKKVGIHLNALYSLNLTDGWAELVDEFLNIGDDKNKLKSFVNTALGELWEEDGAKPFDWTILHNRRERYPAQVPKRAVYVTAGVDTQKDAIHGYIWGFGANEERWLIDRFIVTGNLVTQEPWRQAVKRLRRTYTHESGVPLSVSRVCWDTGGMYAKQVHAVSRQYGTHWILPIRGAPTDDGSKPIANMPHRPGKRGTYYYEVGTQAAKDDIYGAYHIESMASDEPNPKFVHLPLGKNEDGLEICSDQVAQELTVERKELKLSRGNRTWKWSCPQGKRNEATDCFVYALSALHASIQRFHINLNRLSENMLNQQSTKTPTVKRKKKQKVLGGF